MRITKRRRHKKFLLWYLEGKLICSACIPAFFDANLSKLGCRTRTKETRGEINYSKTSQTVSWHTYPKTRLDNSNGMRRFINGPVENTNRKIHHWQNLAHKRTKSPHLRSRPGRSATGINPDNTLITPRGWIIIMKELLFGGVLIQTGCPRSLE